MIDPTVYPAFLKSALRLHLEAKALLNTSIKRRRASDLPDAELAQIENQRRAMTTNPSGDDGGDEAVGMDDVDAGM